MRLNSARNYLKRGLVGKKKFDSAKTPLKLSNRLLFPKKSYLSSKLIVERM